MVLIFDPFGRCVPIFSWLQALSWVPEMEQEVLTLWNSQQKESRCGEPPRNPGGASESAMQNRTGVLGKGVVRFALEMGTLVLSGWDQEGAREDQGALRGCIVSRIGCWVAKGSEEESDCSEPGRLLAWQDDS